MFMENGLLVPKNNIFKDVYNILAWKPSGHVSKIILTCFHYLVPKGLHTKICQKKGQVVSELNKF